MRHCTVYRTACRYSMPNFINLKNSIASNFAYGTLVRKTRYYCTLSRTKNPKSIMPPSCHCQYSISGAVIICTDPALDPDPTLFLWYGTIPVATGTCSSHQCSAWNHRYLCTCRYRYSYLQSSSVLFLGLDPQIHTCRYR
jgi:hypothetical protein